MNNKIYQLFKTLFKVYIFLPALNFFPTSVVYNKSRSKKIIYLTFDDGPIPEVTPWVLDLLAKYNIKVTFFCVGENIVKNPDIFNRIISDGHSVGNHTYSHIKGWETKDDLYFDDIDKCNELIKSSLFRPPYGEASLSQIKVLRNNYKIVMWDVLTGDFSNHLSPEKCLENTIKHTKNGSIVCCTIL
jgi:peptidoglycan/xylan/chitin deacetylase (PgdA/CDA1 family)